MVSLLAPSFSGSSGEDLGFDDMDDPLSQSRKLLMELGMARMQFSGSRNTVKNCIIIDLGEAFVKAGFAGEPEPRMVFPAPPRQQQEKPYTVAEWKSKFFSKLLYQLFFEILQINPKERKVVVLEDFFWSFSFKKALCDSLFKFGVPGVLLVPHMLPVAHLFSLEHHNKILVIDIGCSSSRVGVIANRGVVYSSVKISPFGVSSLVERLRDLLIEDEKAILHETAPLGSQTRREVVEQISHQVLEDLLMKYCFAGPRDTSAKEMLHSKLKTITIPHSCEFSQAGDEIGKCDRFVTINISPRIRSEAIEPLFEGCDVVGEGFSLPEIVIECLRRCPVDIRPGVVNNILLIGGGARIPLFQQRMLKELDLSFNGDRNRMLRTLRGRFDVLKHPRFPPSMMAWIGASVFCNAGIKVDKFRKKPYNRIFDIPDWTTTFYAQHGGKRSEDEEDGGADSNEGDDSAWGSNFGMFGRSLQEMKHKKRDEDGNVPTPSMSPRMLKAAAEDEATTHKEQVSLTFGPSLTVKNTTASVKKASIGSQKQTREIKTSHANESKSAAIKNVKFAVSSSHVHKSGYGSV